MKFFLFRILQVLNNNVKNIYGQVDIYLQSGSPKKAVEVALACREWSTALEIAAEHGIPMVAQSIVDLTK